jgi:hypothetical protein
MMTSTNLSEKEAADYIGLKSRQTLSNWRHQRKGPAYCRIGRRIIYRLEDLKFYMSLRRVDPEDIDSRAVVA